MAGPERVTGTQYRRALVTLAAVLVVGGASLTSPSVLSSHPASPNSNVPTVPIASPTPGASASPVLPPGTVAGTADPPESSGVPTISPTPTVTMTNMPVIKVKRVSVPFTTVTRKDPQLAKGQTKVLRAGVAGLNELTYTDGKLTSTKVVRKPVSKLVSIGTRTTKPWLTGQQCVFERHAPVVRVTVNDPDKVGYHLWIVWGENKRDYKASGTKSFEFQAEWQKLRWTNCGIWLS